ARLARPYLPWDLDRQLRLSWSGMHLCHEASPPDHLLPWQPPEDRVPNEQKSGKVAVQMMFTTTLSALILFADGTGTPVFFWFFVEIAGDICYSQAGHRSDLDRS